MDNNITPRKGMITEERAGEIALKIVIYRATQRRVEFDPGDHKYWLEKANRFNIDIEHAKLLFVEVVLPAAVGRFVGETLRGYPDGDKLRECRKIALKVIQGEQLKLDVEETPEWFRNLAKNISAPLEEVVSLYHDYVIPSLLKWIYPPEALEGIGLGKKSQPPR